MIYNEYLKRKLRVLQDEMIDLQKQIWDCEDIKEQQLLNLELKGVSVQETALRFRLFNRDIWITPTKEYIDIFLKNA